MQKIDSSTPQEQRRLADQYPYAYRYRSFSAKPGSGSVLVKESFDGGTTYDVIATLSSNTSGELVTYDKLIEIECTGNAIALLGG